MQEYQLSNRVLGKDYRERENKERINNWTVEIKILIFIYCKFAILYGKDQSLRRINIDNLTFPIYENVLNVQRPWSADLDSNSTGQIDSMRKDQANEILMLSAKIENSIAIIYVHRTRFSIVETHYQRGLSYARLYERTEDEKADLLRRALNTFYDL
jgi:hypothetical protein